MYKQNVKCMGEVLSNYLEITTPLNMDVEDYLKNFLPTKNKKFSSVFDARKNNVFPSNLNEALGFAEFIVSSLNSALRGNVDYRDPSMKNPYFKKTLENKEFGITHFMVRNVRCLTITDIPVSKIGKLLSEKRILNKQKLNREDTLALADVSLDWLGFALDHKDEITLIERSPMEDVALLRHFATKGRSHNTVDKQDAFGHLKLDGRSFPLMSGVINHMMYTQLIKDINKKFETNTPSPVEENILLGLFVKNTILLDAFRDLGQKNFKMHNSIWKAALGSLVYGDVPFFLNFKLSHTNGANEFFAEAVNNLKQIENKYSSLSDNEKEQTLQLYRGVFLNLINDRVLVADMLSQDGVQGLFVWLQEKARQLSKYEYDSQLTNELDAIKAVVKRDAINFLNVYPLNIDKIQEYSSKLNEPMESVLLGNTLEMPVTNEVMCRVSNVNIQKLYDDLGFENDSLLKALYVQAYKSALSRFYPNVELELKNVYLSDNTIDVIRNFTHANITNMYEFKNKIAPKEFDGINVKFIAPDEEMTPGYSTHVLKVIGTLVNSKIINEINVKTGTYEPFISMDARLAGRSNGDVFNEVLFAMKKTIIFFEDRSYIKDKEIIDAILPQIRAKDLLYKTSISGEVEKREIKVRGKI